MRVLLINPGPPFDPATQPYVTFPNGLLYIAAILEKAGHDVQVYDCNTDSRRPADFVKFNPAVIGLSILSSPYVTDAIALAEEFKELLPGARLIMGGVHASALPEQTMQEPYLDYIAIGAGEYTLLELLDYLENGGDIDLIKGLVHRKGGKVVINEARPFIKDLDELPDPAWHLLDVKKYWDFTLNTSRGCPFRCFFCYNVGFHKGYRGDLSAERMVAQVEHMQKNYGVRHIRFFEDNFTFNIKRLRQFCNLMVERNIKVKWDCESRADIRESDIALMARAGCVSSGLGVETGSPRLLKFLRKGVSIDDAERTFWLMVKYKITPRLYIMEGVPSETLEDFELTHRLLERLDNPPYIYMRFVPYPGSELYEYCVTNKLIEAPPSLAAWADFTVKSATEANLSDVPKEIIDQNTAYYRKTYAWQRLRFTMRHRPGFFLATVLNPAGFFKQLRQLVRIYFSLRFDSSARPPHPAAAEAILKTGHVHPGGPAA